MAITISDVEAFHRFAISRVTANVGTELTFDDLFLEWDSTCREAGAPVFITVKRFNNKAQGRREGGAPWVQRHALRRTPTGSDNMDGHIPQTISRMSGVLPVRRMFNPVGVGGIAFIANPGCAASAATLGFVV